MCYTPGPCLGRYHADRHPVAVLVYVLLIVVAVTAGAGAIGSVGLLIWRWCRTHKDAARARPPFRGALYPLHGEARAAQPLPAARPAIERRQEVHLHLHGVSPEDAAAIIRRAIEDRQADG